MTTGIGREEHDHEGRVLTLEYPGFYLVNCYTPNSQDGLKRLDYRMTWEDAFRAYLLELDAKKPVILCGDLNVAHTEIDIKNAKTNRMSAGFTDQERAKMTELLAAGFTDTFRAVHPDEVKYSWWSYRFHAREKNAAGALIISSFQTASPTRWPPPRSTTRCSVPTTARWSWSSTCKPLRS